MKLNLMLPAACFFAVLTSCHKDNTSSAPPPPDPKTPVITTITPGSGLVGATVTITGINFSSTVSANTVKFNTVAAVVSNASATQLTITVPVGASSGKITVTVDALTATSATDFTVITPVISSFSPVLGLPGDTIVITGSGFSTTAANDVVKFANNATAVVTVATATQLTAVVPAGAVTGTITATINGQQAAGTAGFEVLKDIPRSGLVAFYPFNGNANDASANAFNLSLAGTYSLMADRFGIAGKSYYFNGGNSYAYAPASSAVQVTQPMTVGAWIKYDSLISSSIISKYYPSPGGYILSVGSDGALVGYIDGTTNIFQTSAGVLPANTGGQWIFIAMTYDGATLKMYKNAGLSGSFTHTGTITANTASTMRIGLSGDGGTGPAAFKCSIDDITVYNRVLSDAEMQQLYAQTVSKK